ncbi:YdcF family protein [Terricaulis sp.]|uniref:YdcF family protein n=1 Tax=Terricaulis sp. TaxID=2768686 RepID=UPI002AC39638|nr:YdcF family protein [Terricaulis sp.]MDZ4689729.1 YdcF family protein [Terricaulis sp.]
MRTLLTWVALGLVIAFILGFWNFAERVRLEPEAPPQAQAIVALTGGSLERLSTGVRLLQEQKGERLLISGVNRIVTDQELYEVLEVDRALGECCIDLGRSAEDTLGNASETAAWAREHRYTSLILVTDDYHMPRSHAELSLAMPEAEIYPYPVRTRWTDPALWRSDLGAATRLGGEYVKYLVIRGREAVIDFARSGGEAKDGA